MIVTPVPPVSVGAVQLTASEALPVSACTLVTVPGAPATSWLALVEASLVARPVRALTRTS